MTLHWVRVQGHKSQGVKNLWGLRWQGPKGKSTLCLAGQAIREETRN